MEIERDEGTVSFDRTEILEKWRIKFKDLLTTGKYDTSDIENDFENNNKVDDQHPFNTRITIAEVRKAITNAKNGKAAGIDDMQAEYLKYDCSVMFLTVLFNKCFDSGKIPTIWSKGIINPIPKSTDKDPRQPLNFRGITLISVACKIYCGILNERLMKCTDLNDKLNDNKMDFDEVEAH